MCTAVSEGAEWAPPPSRLGTKTGSRRWLWPPPASPFLLFTTEGKAYWLKVYDIPEASKQAKGYLVSRLVQLAEDERVTAMIPVRADSEGDLFFITAKGTCKRTPISEFANPTGGRASGR
jgi:DNA gyrase/topoisomerase IV subunit A